MYCILDRERGETEEKGGEERKKEKERESVKERKNKWERNRKIGKTVRRKNGKESGETRRERERLRVILVIICKK